MGPCQPHELLTVSPETLQPECKMDESQVRQITLSFNIQLLIGILLPSQVKRVYHMIPRNRIAWGSRISSGTPAQLKLNPCQLVDSNGKCRKLGVGRRNSYSRNRRNFYVKKFKPSRYLSWLKTYRRKN